MVATCAATSAAAPTCRSSSLGPWRGGRPDRRARAGGRRLRREALQRRGARRSHASDHAPWTGWRRSRPQGADHDRCDQPRPGRPHRHEGVCTSTSPRRSSICCACSCRGPVRWSPEEIMDEVWDPHWFGPTKTLDVHISWLRKKLEDDPLEPSLHHHHTRRRVPLRLTEGRLKERSPRRSERVSSWPSPTCSSR